MLVLFGVLIIITSIILGLIVLVQNPKGGGLTGSLGGFSNQLIGVKSSTDVMEKGTWIFAAILGILCVLSPAFIPSDGTGSAENDELLKGVNTRPATQSTQPANTASPALPGSQQSPATNTAPAPATTTPTPAP